MLVLRFYKMFPGGNSTILIEDQDFNATERARIAAELMSQNHLYAEQVGFVRFGTSAKGSLPSLEMMGGEFCGNACRAFGALLALKGQLQTELKMGASSELVNLDFVGVLTSEANTLEGRIRSSGLSQEIPLRVVLPQARNQKAPPYYWEISVGIPLPEENAACSLIQQLDKGIHLVRLSGISHLLLDEKIYPGGDNLLQSAAQWRKRFALEEHEAVGVIWCNQSEEFPCISPVVWVKAMQSAHLESACGSGTLALALLLRRLSVKGQHEQTKNEEENIFFIRQPSGQLFSTRLPRAKEAPLAWLSGPVSIIAAGEAFVFM